MPATSGYRIGDLLYESKATQVYRARRQKDGLPVILKLLKPASATRERITWLRHEYDTICTLNHLAGVAQAYSLERLEHPPPPTWMMVLEDCGGESLDRLGIAGILPLSRFLSLAIAITDTLGQIHQQQMMHKNITPANIVLNPESGEIRIIDFGIATAMPRENPSFRPPQELEGDLNYMSPEQTGRMNRALDYRTDFYSLGATFYELLTGQRPFVCQDALELVHSHIARHPPPPHRINPNIPPVLSTIVLKLMAKNAEDRYHSAHGIIFDLEYLRKQLEEEEWREMQQEGLQDQEQGQEDDTSPPSLYDTWFPFVPGQHDISERFLISPRIYGREWERTILRASFDRVSQGDSEMLLVSGYAGVGKTTLVQEVYEPLTRRRGYFVAGKFNQLPYNTPYLAIVQACRSLIRHLLSESENTLDGWRKKLLTALAPNGQVLLDMLPELAWIIGPQPPVPVLEPALAHNRFSLVFRQFLQVFARPEHPLVLFLDDLQWADPASLHLLEMIIPPMTNQRTLPTALFVIGAYRENEVDQYHPLRRTIETIEQSGLVVHHLLLSPLQGEDIVQLVSETLHCSEERAAPLAELLVAKTGGNPFFLQTFFTSLYADGLIQFQPAGINHSTGPAWHWDLARIQARDVTDNVVDLMAWKIQQLDERVQRTLMLAACIGNQFNRETLVSISHPSLPARQAVICDIRKAIAEGLLIPLDDTGSLPDVEDEAEKDKDNRFSNERMGNNYKFAHDRIHQAVYSLISPQDRATIHWNIGNVLLQRAAPDPTASHLHAYVVLSAIEDQGEDCHSLRDWPVFEITSQYNQGWSHISGQAERAGLAALNLLAGRQARKSTAYHSAYTSMQAGLALIAGYDPPHHLSPLPPISWSPWQHYYELTLALHLEAAETASLSGHIEEMEPLIDTVLAQAKGLQAKELMDRVQAYVVRIQAYIARNRRIEAIQTAISVLHSLGVVLPNSPSPADFAQGMQEIQEAMADRTIDEIISLPQTTDPLKLAAMRILSNISAASFLALPDLLPLITARQITLLLNYGSTPTSAVPCVLYGIMLCGVTGDIDTGYQFGKLALRLSEQPHAREVRTRILHAAHHNVLHWKEYLGDMVPMFQEACRLGQEMGDLEFASYAAQCFACYPLFLGQELPAVEQRLRSYTHLIAQMRQEPARHWTQIYHQVVSNLLESPPHPCCIVGEHYNEETMEPLHEAARDGLALVHLYLLKLFVCYLFGEYREAVKYATRTEPWLEYAIGLPVVPIFYFYDSLARLALLREQQDNQQDQQGQDAPPLSRTETLERIARNQEKMSTWARHAPANCAHRWALVEAERAHLLDNRQQACGHYHQAMDLAQQYGYLHEEALACERTAHFYESIGRPRIASLYLSDACHAYEQWRAFAKVSALEAHSPNLRIARREQEKLRNGYQNGLAGEQRGASASPYHLNALDFASILRTSQAISRDIVLERLLKRMVRIVMENAGAGRSVLLLNRSGQWVVEAEGSTQQEDAVVLQSLPIEMMDSPPLPRSVINYVTRTHESIVLDHACQEGDFASDPYIQQHQVQSLLCTPLLHQSKLTALLYLENNLTTGAFTADRLVVLNLLSSQMAISIENAYLYSHLEEMVQQRTAELSQANMALHEENIERRRAEEALKRAHDELELRVQERTAELSQANQALHEEIAERKRQQAALHEAENRQATQLAVTRILVEAETIEAAIPRLLQIICKGLDWQFGEMWQVDETNEVLYCTHFWCEPSLADTEFARSTLDYTFGRNRGLPGLVWEQGQPDWIYDVAADSSFVRVSEALNSGLRGSFAFPIGYGGTSDGVMCFFSRQVRNDDTALSEMMTDIGRQIGLFFQRKRAEAALGAERAMLAQQVEARTADLVLVNKELAHAVRARDEFLAMMSHELRTPLHAILTLSESLQEGVYGQINEGQSYSLHTIEESGRHLLELINDILDIAKIESGKVDLRIETLVIEQICLSSIKLVREAARKKNLNVLHDIDEMMTTMQADKRRLKQMLVNLLSNAIKFTPDGGSIGLDVVTNAENNIIRFSVWDTGIGIREEDTHLLFQPFVQLDSSLARQYQGTGLGLVMVARLAELHGGSVALESTFGEGSRFTISLPMLQDEARLLLPDKQETLPSSLSTDDQASPHSLILLVDDNESNAAGMGDYLRARGYRVLVAHNGIEAIEMSRKHRPDLILMDIQMPIMDGLEAIRRIRAIEEQASVPIIALTSMAMPGDRERCLAAGANDYLPKPVSMRSLVQIIEKHLVK